MQFSQASRGLLLCSLTSLLATFAVNADSGAETQPREWHEKREDPSTPKRAACAHDNVLRALLAHSSAATSFCSYYISIGYITVLDYGTATDALTTPLTTVTRTYTTQTTAYPLSFSPYLLPSYLYPYQTPSRISSACSCLSIPSPTITEGVPETTTSLILTTSTNSASGPCATQALYAGAFDLLSPSPSPDTFKYVLFKDAFHGAYYPDFQAVGCCETCNDNGPRQGFYGNCVGWYITNDRTCVLLLQGTLGAGYLQPVCSAYGLEDGVLDVNATRYQGAVGGRGQCAAGFEVVG
ncbi:hypothetical protein MMC30_000844 [Trapelia coarctata]|nr:hypothetical protein [Trapelia coarctata]